MIQNRMAARIEFQSAFRFLHKLQKRISPPDDEDGKELFGLARESLPAAQKAFNDALATGDEEQILAATNELVWAVMMLGNFFPPLDYQVLEERKQQVKESARLAGIKSGIIRAQKAADRWEKRALELANASRKINKGWSQEKVAEYVLTHRGQKKDMPGINTLKKSISRWIKQGKLPDRVRPRTGLRS